MTRRELTRILALGALSSVAGCGPIKARLARMMRGCPDAPTPPAAIRSVAVSTFIVATQHVSGGIDIATLAPESDVRKIVLLLPGRGGGPVDAVRDATPYLAATTAPIALVAVDGAESYWHPRAAGQDRLAALFDDVVPWARKRYPKASAKLGIMGMSMGGYGAINVVEQRPEFFDRLCAIAPAIWLSRSEQANTVSDAFDSAEDFAKYDPFAHRSALRGVRTRIVCGTKDPFYHNAFAFADALRRDGLSIETQAIDGGCHEGQTWSRTTESDLAFVAG